MLLAVVNITRNDMHTARQSLIAVSFLLLLQATHRADIMSIRTQKALSIPKVDMIQIEIIETIYTKNKVGILKTFFQQRNNLQCF